MDSVDIWWAAVSRDFLLGTRPTDFDMTTDATPDEIIACFAGHRVVETGIRHGTVTVMIEGMAIEITTHRIEGDYSDSRHPDTVKFTRNLADDLARRDFTINAMAYHPHKGLIDLYVEPQTSKKIIRGVGDPHQRMAKDALRILRGLRFAAVLGFELKPKPAPRSGRIVDNFAIFRRSGLPPNWIN